MQNMSEQELMQLYAQQQGMYPPMEEEDQGGDWMTNIASVFSNPLVQMALMFTPVGGAVGKGLGAGASLLGKTSGMGAKAMGPMMGKVSGAMNSPAAQMWRSKSMMNPMMQQARSRMAGPMAAGSNFFNSMRQQPPRV